MTAQPPPPGRDVSAETIAALGKKSYSLPVPKPSGASRVAYVSRLRRLGADEETVQRLTGPRRQRVPGWRPWARWTRG